MRQEIWKGRTIAPPHHFIQGGRAFDNAGQCYIVKGDQKIEDTPIYNIYPVSIGSVTRVIKRKF